MAVPTAAAVLGRLLPALVIARALVCIRQDLICALKLRKQARVAALVGVAVRARGAGAQVGLADLAGVCVLAHAQNVVERLRVRLLLSWPAAPVAPCTPREAAREATRKATRKAAAAKEHLIQR